MKKSVFRILLIIFGLAHLLPFLAVPYAEQSLLGGLMDGLGAVAGALGLGGMGDAMPDASKITGMAMTKLAVFFCDGDEALTILTMVFFVAPPVIGVIIALMHAIGKGKVSYIFTIILSLASAGAYGFVQLFLSSLSQNGYEVGPIAIIFLALSVVQVIVAIVGIVKDKGEAASAGKNVKVGKKDGTITGVSGSYAGAVIPVKSGDSIVIGRDPASCGIVIKDEKASRKHCTISFNGENGMYSVTDTSSNGVFGKDGRLPANTAVPMSAGSEIRIGKDGDVFRLG